MLGFQTVKIATPGALLLSSIVYRLGRLPGIGRMLRRLARSYPEGSVTTIRAGDAAGMRWKRYHRYVSGYWLGIYEPEIQKALAVHLRPGGVFYDVGANAGFFT